MSEIFTILVEVTKQKGDDLPEEAKGALFLCMVPAEAEEEAIREAVKVFREAGMSPLEVTNYGTIEEREASGNGLSDDENNLAQEAKASNAVIILDKQLIFGDDGAGWVN